MTRTRPNGQFSWPPEGSSVADNRLVQLNFAMELPRRPSAISMRYLASSDPTDSQTLDTCHPVSLAGAQYPNTIGRQQVGETSPEHSRCRIPARPYILPKDCATDSSGGRSVASGIAKFTEPDRGRLPSMQNSPHSPRFRSVSVILSHRGKVRRTRNHHADALPQSGFGPPVPQYLTAQVLRPVRNQVDILRAARNPSGAQPQPTDLAGPCNWPLVETIVQSILSLLNTRTRNPRVSP
jgi:hypothetical protein